MPAAPCPRSNAKRPGIMAALRPPVVARPFLVSGKEGPADHDLPGAELTDPGVPTNGRVTPRDLYDALSALRTEMAGAQLDHTNRLGQAMANSEARLDRQLTDLGRRVELMGADISKQLDTADGDRRAIDVKIDALDASAANRAGDPRATPAGRALSDQVDHVADAVFAKDGLVAWRMEVSTTFRVVTRALSLVAGTSLVGLVLGLASLLKLFGVL